MVNFINVRVIFFKKDDDGTDEIHDEDKIIKDNGMMRINPENISEYWAYTEDETKIVFLNGRETFIQMSINDFENLLKKYGCKIISEDVDLCSIIAEK